MSMYVGKQWTRHRHRDSPSDTRAAASISHFATLDLEGKYTCGSRCLCTSSFTRRQQHVRLSVETCQPIRHQSVADGRFGVSAAAKVYEL